jgi:hypothetical protein
MPSTQCTAINICKGGNECTLSVLNHFFMLNSSFWIRVLIVVIVAVIALSVIPAVFVAIGVPVSGALLTIIRGVIAIIALLVIFGSWKG